VTQTILFTVAYDGAPFAGFVVQKNQRTVAGDLITALRTVDPAIFAVRGASRTDAGVHARGQRVAFDSELSVPPKGWALAVAQRLPTDIAVRRAARVETNFSPRFQNHGKRYRYLVLRDRARDPFYESRAWRVYDLGEDALDVMQREAADLLGTHDFGAFRSAHDQREISVRTLRHVAISPDPEDPRLLRIDVEGDAFLHNMVRIIVGTLVDVGLGRRKQGAVKRALSTQDRREAGITAPAGGLCLQEVLVDSEGEDAWP
jgi:tRNA pseudouridine38-40 synthase